MSTFDILGLGVGDPAAAAPPPAQSTTAASTSTSTSARPNATQQQDRPGVTRKVSAPVASPISSTKTKPTPAAPLSAASTASASSSSSSRSLDRHVSTSSTSSNSTSIRSTAAAAAAATVAASSSPVPGSTAQTPSGVTYTVPAYTPASSSFHRQRWTERQLALRAAEYTDTKQLLIYAATWNVNGKKPRMEADLAPWLLHRIKPKSQSRSGRGDEEDEEIGDGDGDSGSDADRRFRTPDVYVVGFQEIVDLNAGTLLVDHQASAPWEESIHRTIERSGESYVKVTTVHLVGLSMVIFVKLKHAAYVSDVKVDEVGVGIMGVGGNKGAVLVKLKLYRTVFAFINSHLAAHQGATKSRNADFWNIVRRANFEGPRKQRIRVASGEWIDAAEDARRKRAEAAAAMGQSGGMSVDGFAASASSFFDSGLSKFKVIMDNLQKNGGPNGQSGSPDELAEEGLAAGSIEDMESIRNNPHGIFHGTNHIVWLGDNNYRLNVVELGMSATLQLIDREDYGRLLQYDQLIQEKRARRTFVGFVEPRIEFKPTYKFIAGTNEYDRRADKKVRFPAYTDRIQYMTTKPASARQRGGLSTASLLPAPGEVVLNTMHPLFYTSTWKLMASDHKPVMLLLESQVLYDREKSRRRILESLELLSDEECKPKILLSAAHMQFGVVPFDFAVTRTFQIRNVGDAVVAYRIMHRSTQAMTAGGRSAGAGHDASLTKPWLRISPTTGLLNLDQTQTIHVTMHVTSHNGAAQLLNSDADSLACSLLLRLDGGQMYEVRCEAEYEKSICGSDLSYLNALPCKNLRKADPAEVIANDTAYAIPHFLFRLADFMTTKKQIMTVKQNAFVSPTYKDEEEEEDELDVDEPTDSGSGHSTGNGLNRSTPTRAPQQQCTHEMRWLLEYLDTGRSLDKEPKTSKWRNPAAPPPTLSPIDLPASVFWHTLLYFLNSLPQPLLQASTSHRWVNGMDLTAWCYQTLLETEVEKYRTLVYILSFAREIVSHHRSNGCSIPHLSRDLCIALCHRSPNAPMSPIMPISSFTVVQHILTSPEFSQLPQDNAEHYKAMQAAAEGAQWDDTEL